MLVPMRTCCHEVRCHCGETFQPTSKSDVHCFFCRCNAHKVGECGPGCTLHSKKERNQRIDALNAKYETAATMDAWRAKLAAIDLDDIPELGADFLLYGKMP